MRIILILLLTLQVFRASGQVDSVMILTLEKALAMAHRNHPDLSTAPEHKKLDREITSVWFKWLFQINSQQVFQDHLELLADLERIANLRYRQGDIDLLEKSWFLTKLAEIRTNSLVLTHETVITGNKLRHLVGFTGEISPADTGLSIYQVNKDAGTTGHDPEPGTVYAVENLQQELDKCFIRMQYYGTAGLDHARLIHSTSRSKFEAEETDYLTYARAITEAFNLQLAYLEAVNNYNQTAIELEHHAY